MSIVRMLRVTVVGLARDGEAAVRAVQSAGLLHVVRMEDAGAAGSGFDATLTLEEVRNLEAARAAILSYVPVADAAVADWDVGAVVADVQAALATRERAQAALAQAQAMASALEPFGDFDPQEVDALEAAGVAVRFARVMANDWQVHGLSNLAHHLCGQSDTERWAVFVGPDAAALPVTPLQLPRRSLGAVQAEIARQQAELRACVGRVARHARHVGAIDARLDSLADRAAVLRALADGASDASLFAVQGYIPADRHLDLQRAVQPFDGAILADDPAPGEAVPVALHQPAPIAGFAAIVKAFSGMSYWEKDFTPIVMALFLVFGSLCLLDGGYGVLLALTGWWLHRKGNRAFGTVFGVTGVAATLVGMLGGQYFGFVLGQHFWVGHQPPTPLATDPMSCFNFSFVVGLMGVTTAAATAVWQRGWKTSATGALLLALGADALALSTFGGGLLARIVVDAPGSTSVAHLADLIGYVGTALAASGMGAWLLWPDATFGPGKHGANVAWQLYSGTTGLGQDVMSHMRLFGISLSGSILAMVINQIAGMLPLPLGILFAACGHVFVFVLSLLSLYIHSNRLIFLEFGSKCIDGGQAWYEPLRARSGSSHAIAGRTA